MKFGTLADLDLAGRKVLIRVDVNAPVKEGKVSDDTRLRAIAPTVRHVLERGGAPILLGHFGRPNGECRADCTLSTIRPALEVALAAPVEFCPETVGPEAMAAVASLRTGSVLLLENTRFDEREMANDAGFAAEIAALGDVFVNDAFSCAHRAHASTEALARYLPAVAGMLMEAELKALASALEAPARPVVAVVGGAKVSTKLALLGSLSAKVDAIVIGGGMANTFLSANGKPVGASLCEPDLKETAREVVHTASRHGCEIVLPSDLVVAREFRAGAESAVVPADGCPDNAMILDVGPQTIADVKRRFDGARTLLWNGPLGAFEIDPFNTATNAAALHAAMLTDAGRLLSVAGGGDTVAALNASGSASRFSYVSTAGGAFLEWLEGRTLPGVAALSKER